MRSASVAVAHLVNGNTPIVLPLRNYSFYTLIRYINLFNEVSVAAVQHFWPSISNDVFHVLLPVWEDAEANLQRRFGAVLIRQEVAARQVVPVYPA